MSPKRTVLFALALAALAPAETSVAASYDDYCSVPGFAVPLRQTVLILDEHHVFAEDSDQVDPRNAPWRKFIGNLLLADEASIEQNLLPRERVTVLLARKDGAGIRTVFTGCMPFFSATEKSRIAKDKGVLQSVNTFFGTGPIASAKRSMSLFQSRLGDAVREALQPSMLSTTELDRTNSNLPASGFATSLKQGSAANPIYGLPRIILFSDLSRFLRSVPPDRARARQSGFKMADLTGLNFKGAEIYVVGMSGSAVSHDALEAFFLASHGELMSTGSANIVPAFVSAPIRVARYQGLIQYPDNQFPIRIRLAIDQNGSVTDSWISVQTSKEQFAPFHGVVTCDANGLCTFTGDDVFAQVWSINRAQGAEPTFDQSLPFAGARALSFHFDGNWIKGNISDTLVRFQGLKSYKLEFTAGRNNTSLFP
jgi:hypothetical protein